MDALEVAAAAAMPPQVAGPFDAMATWRVAKNAQERAQALRHQTWDQPVHVSSLQLSEALGLEAELQRQREDEERRVKEKQQAARDETARRLLMGQRQLIVLLDRPLAVLLGRMPIVGIELALRLARANCCTLAALSALDQAAFVKSHGLRSTEPLTHALEDAIFRARRMLAVARVESLTLPGDATTSDAQATTSADHEKHIEPLTCDALEPLLPVDPEPKRGPLLDSLVATVHLWHDYLMQERALGERLNTTAGSGPSWKETSAWVMWMVRRQCNASEALATRSVEEILTRAKEFVFSALYPQLRELSRGEWNLYWARVEQSCSVCFSDAGRLRWKLAAESGARAAALRNGKDQMEQEAAASQAIGMVNTLLYHRATSRTPSSTRDYASPPLLTMGEASLRRMGLVDYASKEQQRALKEQQRRRERQQRTKTPGGSACSAGRAPSGRGAGKKLSRTAAPREESSDPSLASPHGSSGGGTVAETAAAAAEAAMAIAVAAKIAALAPPPPALIAPVVKPNLQRQKTCRRMASSASSSKPVLRKTQSCASLPLPSEWSATSEQTLTLPPQPPTESFTDEDSDDGLIIVSFEEASKSHTMTTTAAWSSAELANAVCNILVLEGKLKARPPKLRIEREEKISQIFEAAGLDGAKLVSETARDVDFLLRKFTHGEVWVDHVQKALRSLDTSATGSFSDGKESSVHSGSASIMSTGAAAFVSSSAISATSDLEAATGAQTPNAAAPFAATPSPAAALAAPPHVAVDLDWQALPREDELVANEDELEDVALIQAGDRTKQQQQPKQLPKLQARQQAKHAQQRQSEPKPAPRAPPPLQSGTRQIPGKARVGRVAPESAPAPAAPGLLPVLAQGAVISTPHAASLGPDGSASTQVPDGAAPAEVPCLSVRLAPAESAEDIVVNTQDAPSAHATGVITASPTGAQRSPNASPPSTPPNCDQPLTSRSISQLASTDANAQPSLTPRHGRSTPPTVPSLVIPGLCLKDLPNRSSTISQAANLPGKGAAANKNVSVKGRSTQFAAKQRSSAGPRGPRLPAR